MNRIMSDLYESNKNLNVRSCRVCLDSKCVNVVTLDEQNGWLELFEFCFDISLSSQDEPRVLCEQCACNVKSYTKFKKLCHRSDKIWKSLNNEACSAEKVEVFENDEKSHKENVKQYYNDNYNNDDIKPISAIKTDDIIVYNDNSINDEIENEINTNDNLYDSGLCDIKNSDILFNHKAEDEVYIPDIKEKKHSNESIKVKDTFKCEKCQKNYASRLWYSRHIKSCDFKIQQLSSFSCNQVYIPGTTNFISQDNIAINKTKEIKKESVLYFCGVCSYSSDGNEDLNKHLNEHWTNNDLQCRLCEFVGKDQAAVAAHRYVHSKLKNSSFTCHICSEKTRSLLTLQFHYRKIHLNKSGGLCSQPHCDKVYNSWRLWKSHEKLHNHPGYVCDICGQKYRHRHLIIEHLINHTNPPTHVCDVCGKTFLRLRNLRVHIENVHSKPDPIKCSHCNRMFKNQHYLRVHQRREAMDKVWKCEFCPLEYPMLSALNVHMRSHSDERPYCCHICGSRYKGKGQLIVHMRNHTGCRPFKCVECAKGFTSSAQLKTHSIIHTGILPYKCMHCDKSFRCKKRMMKHCAFSHKAVEKA